MKTKNSFGQNVVFVFYFLKDEDRRIFIYWMESPDYTYHHTFLCFSFWRFVKADFKIYCFVF